MNAFVFRIPKFFLAVILPLAALGLQYFLRPDFSSFDWLFFCLAVALSAWRGGWLAGFIATLVSACLGLFFFNIPSWANPEGGWQSVLTTIVFIGVGLLISSLFERLRSAREAAAKALQQNNTAIAALSEKERKISEINERLLSFDRLKSRFLVNFSHGLRTPLTLILGYAQQALAVQSEGPVRTSLQGVQRNAWILLEQVNNLLEATKLEGGDVVPIYNEVDLAKIIHRATVHFDAVARNKNCDFTIEVPPSAVVQTDAEMVQRILTVILSNAFKFTPVGGKVRCTLRAPNERASTERDRSITFEVADSGPGIPESYAEIIFDHYIEGDESWAQQLTGAGLGLMIAKEFAKLLGGKIKVGRAPEGGALLTVDIPVYAPPGVSVGRVSADFFQEPTLPVAAALSRHYESQTAAMPDNSRPGAKKPVVLVVDDSIEMVEYLVRSFSADFQVVTALDGLEGLAKAKSVHPDLIVCDMMMPVMNGEQMFHELKAIPELDSVPFIFLTAKADENVIVRMLREGAQDYLVKPFSHGQLRAKALNLIHAHALMNRRAAAAPAPDLSQ